MNTYRADRPCGTLFLAYAAAGAALAAWTRINNADAPIVVKLDRGFAKWTRVDTGRAFLATRTNTRLVFDDRQTDANFQAINEP